MDALKLLESVEEVLYRTALWVLLVPRTLLQIIRRPHQVYPYVAGELAKAADDRFKDRLSPVLLWTLAALVPHLMMLDYLATLPDSRVATEAEWKALMSAPWSTRLAVVSVVALAGPLAFARRTLKDLKIALDRDTLRRPFFVQCYCFTPAYVVLLPVIYYLLRYDAVPAGLATLINAVAWLAFASWLTIAESLVLSDALGIRLASAFVKAVRYFGSAVVLLFVLELFIITLYQGFAVWTR